LIVTTTDVLTQTLADVAGLVEAVMVGGTESKQTGP
jgi:hypothetical protein